MSVDLSWKRQFRRSLGARLDEPVAQGVDLVGHYRVDGRVDGLQLQCQQVGDRYYLYVGHFWSGGISVLDVTNPESADVVAFIPTPNEHTWHVKVQVADDILMTSCEAGLFIPSADPRKALLGARFFDVSDPTSPRELSFWAADPVGFGVHRAWWNGGRYAYLPHGVEAPGVSYRGRADRTRVMTILDLDDPTAPRAVSDFWLPVQASGGDGIPEGVTFGVHEPVVHGDRAYVAYADGGFAIVDVGDPQQPRLVSHVQTYPELSDGDTHTCVPLPDRDLLIVSEEALSPYGLEGPKDIRIWDISNESKPALLSTLDWPEPSDREPWESYLFRGERFGPHCLHDNHVGTLQVSDRIYNAYMNAGLRIWDIADPSQPRESAFFVPPDPTEWADPRPYVRGADVFRGGTRGSCVQDVIVDPRGYIFLSGYNDGIWVVREQHAPEQPTRMHGTQATAGTTDG